MRNVIDKMYLAYMQLMVANKALLEKEALVLAKEAKDTRAPTRHGPSWSCC
jgi:hypothetical protein